MTLLRDDILTRLRAIIAGWKAEVGAAQESLANQFAASESQLAQLMAVLTTRDEHAVALAAAHTEIERLRRKLEEAEMPAGALTHYIPAPQPQLDGLRRDLQALHERMAAAIAAWTAEISKACEGLTQQIETANGQFDTLLALLKAHGASEAVPEDGATTSEASDPAVVETLRQNNATLVAQLDTMRAELQTLDETRRELDALRAEQVERERAAESLGLAHVDAQHRIATLESELAASQSKTRQAIATGEHGVAELAEEIAGLQAQYAEAAETAERAEHRATALETELAEQTASVSLEKESALAEARERLHTLEEERARTQAALDAAAQARDALQEQVSAFEAQIETLHQRDRERLDAARKLLEELETHRRRLAPLETEAAETRQALELLRVERDAETRVLADLRAANEALQASLSERDAQMARLREDLARRESELEATRRDQGMDRTAVAELEAALLALRAQQARIPTSPASAFSAQASDATEDCQRIVLSESIRQEGRRPLGEMLVAAGLLNELQLQEALREQRRTLDPLIGVVLVNLGYCSEAAVTQAVALQLGLPMLRVHPGLVDPDALRLIHKDACTWRLCVPLRASDTHLVAAMANPQDESARRKLEDLGRRTLIPVIATPSDILRTIDDVYGIY